MTRRKAGKFGRQLPTGSQQEVWEGIKSSQEDSWRGKGAVQSRKCHTRGEVGYITQNCPKISLSKEGWKSTSKVEKSVKCYNCGRIGHMF